MKKLLIACLILLCHNTVNAQMSGVKIGKQTARCTCIGASSCEGSGSTSGFGMRDTLQDLMGIESCEWVGSEKDPASSATYGVHHWGIGGRRIDTINSGLDSFLDTYFPTPNPQGTTIISHIGGADIVFDAEAPASVAAKVQTFINTIQAHDSSINIIFSTTQPQNQTSTGTVNTNLQSYHSEVSTIITAERSGGATNVHYHDLFTALVNDAGFPSSVMHSDNVHMGNGGHDLWANGVFDIWAQNIN
jgi:lysophospholipase L1-like esterase